MLLAMIPYLNGQGEVQASVTALAREIGVSRTTAWRILRDLEERGEIERVETGQWRWKLPVATDGYFNAQAYDTAWRIAAEARLPTSQRLVFLAVASHVNQKGWAWPSIARIARMTGLSRRTVLDALKALSPSYLQPDIKPGPKGTTRYRVATLHSKNVSVLHSKTVGTNEGVAVLHPKGVSVLHPRPEAPGKAVPYTANPQSIEPAGVSNLHTNKEEGTKSTNTSSSASHPKTPRRQEGFQNPKGKNKAGQGYTTRVAELRKLLGDERLAILRQLIRPRNNSQWARWLALALYPHARRLGEAFIPALDEAMAAASGPGVHQPDRLILARLEKASIPGLQPRAKPGESYEDYLRRAAARAPEETTVEVAADNPFRRFLDRRCPYGDHPAGDACCPPMARETLARLDAFLQICYRQGRVDAEAASAARRYLEIKATLA